MPRTFREAEHDGWTTRAASYDAAFSAITNQAIPHVLSVFGALADKTLLDVCSGPGHLAAEATARGAKAVGVDFAATMVARARANHPDVDFRIGDAEALAFDDATFDCVACSFGIMHVARAEVAMSEAARVLKPGGVYAFTHWGLDDELLQIVNGVMAAHGQPLASLPAAPPLMRFADPAQCTAALGSAGFERVEVGRIALPWRAPAAEDVLGLIYAGAVRAEMLIEGQAPERRERVRAAIVEAAGKKRSGSEIVIRRTAVLATGRKL